MRRFALIASVLLPLPFAALPLAAVLFSADAPATGSDLAITTEVVQPAGVTEAVTFATGVSHELPCDDFANVT